MGSVIPKQYLSLHDKTVLDNTLEHFINHPQIDGVVVAISADDAFWLESSFVDHPDVKTVKGGAERCFSVLNALELLIQTTDAKDHVLVHDAARPCVRGDDVTRLINKCSGTVNGGLLGLPVRDTMKRTDSGNAVMQTVDREQLWHAFTPQMFQLGILHEALQKALDEGQEVTDDASAMELAGYKPMMIEGAADNIKITRPEDLVLAAWYLEQQTNQRLNTSKVP